METGRGREAHAYGRRTLGSGRRHWHGHTHKHTHQHRHNHGHRQTYAHGYTHGHQHRRLAYTRDDGNTHVPEHKRKLAINLMEVA